MNEKKNEKEFRIFSEFISCAGIQVKLDSIQNQDPRKPDILCEINDVGFVEFELTEILDSKLMGHNILTEKSIEMLYEYLRNLPIKTKDDFKNKFKNTNIYVLFKENTTIKVRRNAIPLIFERLMNLNSKFHGIALKNVKGLKKVIKYVTVNRDTSSSLSFDVHDPVFVAMKYVDVLEKKFNKTYDLKYPFELLIYIESNPKFPDNDWKPDVNDFLNEYFNDSPFRKIWYFDLFSSQIIFQYPE